jgi:acyl carrier protein
MNKEEIITKLKEIIKPYINNVEAFENLTEATDFIVDLKINSANLIDIMLDLEDAFVIDIENQDMEKILNVKAALEIIEIKLANK